jgi:formylglycine-generating enzyme required for sulfatase activity
MPIRKCLTLALAATCTMAAPAFASSPWLDARQKLFDEWSEANPELPERIAELKARTSEKIAEYRERKAEDDKKWREHTRDHWEALLDVQKNRVASLVEQGDTAAKVGNCGDAVNIYGQVLAIDRVSVEANTGMGKCLTSEGKLERAATYLTRAIDSPADDEPSRLAKLGAMMALQTLPPPPDPRVSDPPAIFRVADAPKEVWDAPEAPVMVIIPAGDYTMGAPATEQYFQKSEGQHRVTIDYPLAVSKFNVTRGEFAAFAADTGYDEKGCDVWVDGTFKFDPEANWQKSGFEQTDDDAVACITWHDAQAYAGWLSAKTGHRYRLPTEAEWEYAVRGGTTTIYYWGTDIGEGNANCDGCYPGEHRMQPSAGGNFPANPFGLYDMVGNVWKWLEDCWNPTYDGAPSDGSAWKSGNCSLRGRRTGSWFNLEKARPDDPRAPGRLRSAGRFGSMPGLRISSFGFRVVREL